MENEQSMMELDSENISRANAPHTFDNRNVISNTSSFECSSEQDILENEKRSLRISKKEPKIIIVKKYRKRMKNIKLLSKLCK